MQSMTRKQANQKLDHTLHRSVCSKQQAVLNFCRHHLRCTWDSAHNRQTPCHKACLKSDCTDLCWCDSACPLTACERLLCALPLECSSQAAWFPLVPDANYPLLCLSLILLLFPEQWVFISYRISWPLKQRGECWTLCLLDVLIGCLMIYSAPPCLIR